MEINPDQVAARISRLMQQLHLTQKQFAARLQVTQPAVSKYLQGRIPPAPVLLRLAGMGGTSMEWLLTGEATPLPPGTLAETQAAYGLAEKMEHLPATLQRPLLSLVETMLQELKYTRTGK